MAQFELYFILNAQVDVMGQIKCVCPWFGQLPESPETILSISTLFFFPFLISLMLTFLWQWKPSFSRTTQTVWRRIFATCFQTTTVVCNLFRTVCVYCIYFCFWHTYHEVHYPSSVEKTRCSLGVIIILVMIIISTIWF